MSIKDKIMNIVTSHPRLVTFSIGLAITFAIGVSIGTMENHQTDVLRLIVTTGGPGQHDDGG